MFAGVNAPLPAGAVAVYDMNPYGHAFTQPTLVNHQHFINQQYHQASLYQQQQLAHADAAQKAYQEYQLSQVRY